jgi:lipopolysaccharide/colanic/teichoic acid biosynthesis glycosyltransferase
LVGPRPGLPVQKDLTLARQIHGVYSVKPGITGLSQINGVDMSDPERLAELDAQYIARRGLILDIKIIISTFLGSGQGDRVGP